NYWPPTGRTSWPLTLVGGILLRTGYACGTQQHASKTTAIQGFPTGVAEFENVHLHITAPGNLNAG
uniref:hypothetical protein n=1 Tax=Rhodococcus sp. YL-0 TaxID=1930581 RepID=UPI001CC0090E